LRSRLLIPPPNGRARRAAPSPQLPADALSDSQVANAAGIPPAVEPEMASTSDLRLVNLLLAALAAACVIAALAGSIVH